MLFLALHSLFYVQNPVTKRWDKILDCAIMEFITWLSIACWLADDGTVRNGSSAFCTDSFGPDGIALLQHIMLTKFGITLELYYHSKHYPRLQVARSDMPKFAAAIKPYLHPSMLYKLGDFQ
jgi:hypothetical protein